MGINQNYTHIKVVFYYNNPSSYPDTGRSIQDILGGHYELKKAFFYEDIKNYRFLEAVMTEQPVIIEDFDALRIRKEFVDCLCIISLDYRIVLSFTYTERKVGTRGNHQQVDLFLFKIQKSAFVLLKQYTLIDIKFNYGEYYQYQKLGCMCTHNGKGIEIQIYDEFMSIVDTITVTEETENVRKE